MRKLRIPVVFAILLMLTGCLQTNVLDKISLLSVIGYDAFEDRSFEVTGCFIETLPDAKDKNRIAAVHSRTSKGARMEMNEQLPYHLGSGQTRAILLDRNIFKYEMIKEIEVLTRDPSYGDVIYVALADSTVKDVLGYSYKKIPHIGIFLFNLLEHNTTQNWIPTMTLHEFTRCRDQHISELALPIVKRVEEDVKITGLALLRGDEIVGEATPREGYLIKTLKGEKSEYLYEVDIDHEELMQSGMKKYLQTPAQSNLKVVFNVIKADRKIKLRQADPPIFDVNLSMNIDIHELSERYKFQDPGAMEALRRQLDEEVSDQLQQLIHKLQSIGSDCIGFGEKYRSKVPNIMLSNGKWLKEFPQAKINAYANMTIIRTGTME